MKLSDVLRPEHIVAPLEAETFRGALDALVQRLAETGEITDPERLGRLTAQEHVRDVVHVGDRVLLPHMRTDAVTRLAVAIGIADRPLRSGADPAEGNELVVVLVLAPPAASHQYLQIVAALARALRDDATVDRLVAARSPEEVLETPGIRDLAVPRRLAVRDVMTQRVYRVYADTPLREVLELMIRHDLKAVPVVNEKREVLGVVTDRDVLRHLTPGSGRVGAAEQPDLLGGQRGDLEVAVREVMSRSVMCISEDQGLAETASIMINKDVERIPVVSEGKLTGFLTRGDLLRKLYGR